MPDQICAFLPAGEFGAIAAYHDAVNGRSLGKHDPVIRFLRGTRRLSHASSSLGTSR